MYKYYLYKKGIDDNNQIIWNYCETFKTLKDCSNFLGVTHQHIHNIITKKIWFQKKYIILRKYKNIRIRKADNPKYQHNYYMRNRGKKENRIIEKNTLCKEPTIKKNEIIIKKNITLKLF